MNEGTCAVVDRLAPTRPPGALARRGFSGGRRRLTLLLAALLVLPTLAACESGESGESGDRFTFRLVTGTENRRVEGADYRSVQEIVEDFADEQDVRVEFTFQGSVDTMIELQDGAEKYDAVWPAGSIWLALGDTQRVVEQAQSIMATPVVFGVKKGVAERLGWVGRDVRVEEILAAAEAGQLRYMTTSATQSNSGAMAYLGYLYAFAGQPQVLTSDMLHDPTVVEPTRRLLNLVDRSAGASGFLRNLFLQDYDHFDGMVNNESAIITANQQLTAQGKDPLYVIYPVDGLAIADWPLGFVDHGDPAKAEFFAELQAHLQSPAVQKELLDQGRRTGLALNPADADPQVFNPDWGIDLSRVIQPITLPTADVIREALDLYQTELRKPSFTVYCLDYSGSMQGDGERELKSAMRVLLDPDQAARYLLQPASGDATIVIPFDDGTRDQWRTDGNDPDALRVLLARVTNEAADGGTAIYGCLIAALDAMADAPKGYEPAIILMTDGKSNEGPGFDELQARLGREAPGSVPVYGIMFGDASEDQLNRIAEATSGRVFDGRDDLIGALRDAKANN